MMRGLHSTASIALLLVYTWNVGVLAPTHRHVAEAEHGTDGHTREHHHYGQSHAHGHNHEHDHEIARESGAPTEQHEHDHSHDCPVCQHLALVALLECPTFDFGPVGSVWIAGPPQRLAPICEPYGIARARAPPENA